MKKFLTIIKATLLISSTLFICSCSDNEKEKKFGDVDGVQIHNNSHNQATGFNNNIILILNSPENFEKFLKDKKQKLGDNPLNNSINKIALEETKKKLNNIQDNYLKSKKIIRSIQDFILKENMKINISEKDKELINNGDIKTIENSLQQIKNNTKDIEKSAEASFKQGELYEELMEYEKAQFNYKEAVDTPNYNNQKYREKGIRFSKKLNRKKDEKYFKDKLYYGLLKMKKDSIYTGIIKNGKASYCGIERYKDGSYYIGQYDNGHRIGYGFVYIQGRDKPYLRRYNNDGSIASRYETISVKKIKRTKKKRGKILMGKMKNGSLQGRGFVEFDDGSQLIANFSNGIVSNSIGCYFDGTKKRVTWQTHNKSGKKTGSWIIESNK